MPLGNRDGRKELICCHAFLATKRTGSAAQHSKGFQRRKTEYSSNAPLLAPLNPELIATFTCARHNGQSLDRKGTHLTLSTCSGNSKSRLWRAVCTVGATSSCIPTYLTRAGLPLCGVTSLPARGWFTARCWSWQWACRLAAAAEPWGCGRWVMQGQ